MDMNTDKQNIQHSRHEDVSPVSTLLTDQNTSNNNNNTYPSVRESEDTAGSSPVGAAGLSVLLGQMVAYFSGRAHVDDLDVLSFSLHHLFCHVDYLYQTVLPELLGKANAPMPAGNQTITGDLLQRQRTWSQLRIIKHTINRMEPLCTLLSDATSCILDALDRTSITTPVVEDEMFSNVTAGDEQDWLQALNQERWEHALATLTESLSFWQQSYSQLAQFGQHFASAVSAVPALLQLDDVFNVLLDSTGAIFCDILPDFQAISVGDDDAVTTLLFDLMQQADQLLVQFDKTLEPLHDLIEHFSLIEHR